MLIKPGNLMQVITASGSTVTMRALSGPVDGLDFTVVWACTEQEYAQGQACGVDVDDMDGIPWPLSAIAEVVADDPQPTSVTVDA